MHDVRLVPVFLWLRQERSSSPEETRPARTPFWKKELRLRKRPIEPAVLPIEAEVEETPGDAVERPEPKAKKKSFWSTEIRFGRRREGVEETTEEVVLGVTDEDEAVAEVEVEPIPLPVPPLQPEVDPEPELEPAASAPEPVADVEDEITVELPAPAPEPITPAAAPVDAVAPEVEPEPVAAEAAAEIVEPAAVEADEPTESVVLEFSRSRRRPPVEPAPEPAAPVSDTEPVEIPAPTRRKRPVEPVVELVVEPAPEPVVEPVLEALADAEPTAEEDANPERKSRRSFGRKRREDGAAAETTEKPKKRAGRAKADAGRKRVPGRRGKKEIVGLKIGASKVAAAYVSNNGSPELLQIATEPLEQGVVVGGELRDPDALAQTLEALFRKHKLPKRAVRLGVATNRIGVRSFTLSGIEDPKQLTNAVRFRAQDALPIPLNEAALDYHVLEESVDADGVTHRRVLLVVAYRDLVDRYAEACRKAGLKLIGVDLEAFAVLRALAAPRPADEPSTGALVVVSIGHDGSLLAVSDGRVCEFTRVLDWGGSAIDVAIASALDMTPEEAEPIKRGFSLSDPTTPIEGLDPESAAKVREAVSDGLQGFARELVSSLHFYQSQPGSLEIAEVVLTGGGAHLDGLAEELGRLTGVRVRVGDPLVRIKLGKKVGPPQPVGALSVAIGLGIED